MSKYDAYRNRLNASSGTFRDSVRESTKRQQKLYFMSSPSLSHVIVENEEKTTPCIVSNKDTYHVRKFLFLPDYKVNNGNYILHEGLTYLVTDINMDDIYPEALGDLCNDTFPLVTSERVEIGRDDFKRPIFEYREHSEDIPCSSRTKAYSTAENASIPLPDGTMLIKIPYKPNREIPLNYQIEKRKQKFQVANISYENVLNEIGCIEITLQRVV